MKNINRYSPIYAMAIINPGLCKNSSIQVEVEQRDEGPVPHVHVYLDKTRNPKNCSYVRLDQAEYCPHHSDGKRLTGKQKEHFLQIMDSIWNKTFIQSTVSDEVRPATGYEAAVNIWLDTFGNTVEFQYDSQGFPIMPDYANL